MIADHRILAEADRRRAEVQAAASKDEDSAEAKQLEKSYRDWLGNGYDREAVECKDVELWLRQNCNMVISDFDEGTVEDALARREAEEQAKKEEQARLLREAAERATQEAARQREVQQEKARQQAKMQKEQLLKVQQQQRAHATNEADQIPGGHGARQPTNAARQQQALARGRGGGTGRGRGKQWGSQSLLRRL